jgi:hypothetical protein
MSEAATGTTTAPRAGVPPTVSLTFPRHPIRALVHAWLILDFFADNRRSGQPSSSLTSTIFGQAFLALVFAAVLFPDVPPAAFAAANMSLSTLLVGIGSLGDETVAARMRADRALVAVSPLPARAVLAARALHASFYVCLLTIGMALPPAILLAFLPGHGFTSVPPYLVLACACAGLFTGALALLLRALTRWLGAARAALLGGTLKALLLFGGLLAFAFSARALRSESQDTTLPAWLAAIWPPVFGGRAIAGDVNAWLWFTIAAAVLVLVSLPLAKDPELTAARNVGTPRLLAVLNAHLAARNPVLHGVAAFSSAMLYRSAGFRSKVLPLFGLPAGMWLLAYFDRDGQAAERLLAVAAQLPGVYLPFLCAFLGAGDEPRARWVFATAPNVAPALLRRGLAIALTTHVLLPVHVILFAASVPAVGWVRALATSTLALGLAMFIARLTLRAWTEVPFSSEVEGDGLEFGSLLTFAIALTLVGLGAAALAWWLALPLGLVVFLLAYLSLRRNPQ